MPQPAPDILIDARGLGVRRGGRWLVRGVDLAVRAGEIVTLIGPNGSGKTTTVKAMLGVTAPDAGSVRRRRNLKVGYVPQRLAVDGTLPLSVERMMRLTQKLPDAAVAAALQATGVAHLARSNMRALSGGELQRVLLARAVAGDPDLLVLDEPVQGVDYTGEIALYELIADIRRRIGCGILLISHDLHIVMAQTDTVVCLNGHVCCQGTPQIVASSPEYARLFGPRASKAFALYAHDHDHAHLPDGTVVAGGKEGPARTLPDPHHLDGHGHLHAHPPRADAAGAARGRVPDAG